MRIVLPLFIVIALLDCPRPGMTDEKLTVEDIVSRHRNAIGADGARAAAKTRVAEGTVRYRITTGGTADLEGKATMVSEKEKIRLVLRFSVPSYPGENYVTDGARVLVMNKPRSGFGELVYNQEAILRDGLLGGVLTTAWPFLSSDLRQAKLSYTGLKKADDRQLHEVRFTPKKRSELDIRLYFDPESFQHVMTVYTMEVAPKLIGSETDTARQQTVRYRLEERFGDFQAVDGLTLPSTWKIKLTMAGYQSSIVDWDVKFENLMTNQTLDPRNFPMK